MSGEHYRIVWQHIELGANRLLQHLETSVWKICSADTLLEQYISAKNDPWRLASPQKNDVSDGMSRTLEDFQIKTGG